MRWTYLAALVSLPLALAASPESESENGSSGGVLKRRDYDARTYYAIELEDGKDISEFLQNRDSAWSYEEPFENLDNIHLFSIPIESNVIHYGIRDRPRDQLDAHLKSLPLHKRSAHDLAVEELISDGVKRLQVLEPKVLEKRGAIPVARPVPVISGVPVDSSMKHLYDVSKKLHIDDPEFAQQWHLINPAQVGHDLNISGVWEQNITGKGVAVAVVDDGLDLDHPDLHDNYYAEGSYDFNDQRPDPRPVLDDDRHGTRCAGEIAAVRNEVCGIGVAYEANIAGLRILSGRITEAEEAKSLNYAMDKNHIYSCSWGPPDDGRSVAEPGMVVRRAIMNGVLNGRQKKGSIFVFASGNGAAHGDNCNFDGYTNSIYSITVAAIDRRGLHPFYSEQCSANMVVTYSSGSGDHIHTTDFHNGCTAGHGGTSAAAPIAAGVFALVLETRPELTWRDMQYLAWDTAVPVNEEDGWQDTFAGKKFSHKYGYGKLDAYAIVERAKTWDLVKPQAWYFAPRTIVNKKMGYGQEKALVSEVEVTEAELAEANVDKIEHVNVYLNLELGRRGAVTVVLTSPEGIKSRLAEPRPNDASEKGLIGWTFMSVAHWGEPGVGKWKLEVFNDQDEASTGTLYNWRLKLWGEAKDASKAKPFPLSEDESVDPDPDHREQPTLIPGISPTAEPSVPSEPSSKSSGDLPASTTAATSPVSSHPSRPTKPSRPSETTSAVASPSSSSKTWSLIPTFGLTSRTLAWVYGSILLIVAFLGGVGAYICISRRRQRDSYQAFKDSERSAPVYEFDVLSGEDNDDNLSERDRFLESDEEEFHDLEGTPPQEDGGKERGPTVGQRARGLYETPENAPSTSEGEELFKVDSDDE